MLPICQHPVVGQSYGEIIRRGREQRALSQRALAARAGVDSSTLAKVEIGTRPPFDEPTTMRIARAIGASPLRLAAAFLRRAGWPESARIVDDIADQDHGAGDDAPPEPRFDD